MLPPGSGINNTWLIGTTAFSACYSYMQCTGSINARAFIENSKHAVIPKQKPMNEGRFEKMLNQTFSKEPDEYVVCLKKKRKKKDCGMFGKKVGTNIFRYT